MAINQFPASSTRFGETLTSSSGVFTVDCSTGTDFNLNLNTSDLNQAFGFVNSSSANFGSATSGTLTLPSSMQGGDLVIVAVGSDGSQPALPSGWTQIDATQQGTLNQITFYKVMEATPDTSVAITGMSTAAVAVAMAFRDVSFQSFGIAGAGTGLPNPPSVTTTINNSIVVAIGILDDDNVTLTAPAGYSNIISQSASTTGCSAAIAIKTVASAGAEDPAAFGVASGVGDDDNIGISVILAPTTARTTINITNVPNEIKEFKIYGYRENTNALSTLRISWDTDIVRISNLQSSITNQSGIFQTFFSYNGVLYCYNPPQKIQHVDYIKSTQIWRCPSDVYQVQVLLCGGGSGGDDGAGASPGAGSVIEDTLSVTPGASYTITIGAGGAAGASGAAGGTSSFGSLLSVAGGGTANSTTPAIPGGLGGYGIASTGAVMPGLYGYGSSGTLSTGAGTFHAAANSGRGGLSAVTSNGGSGICIIKYWSVE